MSKPEDMNGANFIIGLDDTGANNDAETSHELPVKVKSTKTKKASLNKYLVEDPKVFEVGVDEVGRGPMFGRVYTAAVILPKDDSFDFSVPFCNPVFFNSVHMWFGAIPLVGGNVIPFV